LVRRAVELAKTLRDTRSVLAKALGDEAAMKAVALTQNILEGVAKFVENPQGFSIEDFRRLQAKIFAANELVAQALTGRGQQPPLRSLQGDAEEEEEADEEESQDETQVPPNLDEDVDSDSVLRPSQLPRPPPRKKAKRPANKGEVEELRKSATAILTFQAKERLQGVDTSDDFINGILPVRRRTRDSAIMQTPGSD
jgi:hypothetical protein